jgi:hypothetical protein
MFKKILFLILVILCICGMFIRAQAQSYLGQIQKAIAEKGLHWTAGKTSVSDLSEEQKKNLCGLIIPPEVKARFDELNKLPPPSLSEFGKQTRWDWREHNGVTPVKNQGNCGSCWDFAATGALESMVKIYTSATVLDLSEQQVLSCNTSGGNCNGGWMQYAYEVFLNYGAIMEGNMPYQASDQVPCTQNSWQPIVDIRGWTDIANNVPTIKNALAAGPIAVAMSVFGDFYLYTGGCYVNAGGSYLGEHAVLIIGWEDTLCGGQGGWIVKNSWGAGWGESGFFKIGYGDCNIGYAGQLLDYVPDFCDWTDYGAGDGPYSVFCADLDGDGDLDLAVANQWSDNVSILKNNGDGTFQSAVNYGAGYYRPECVFCADLDGDGDLDLAVANSGGPPPYHYVSILKNNGDGTFQSAVKYGAGDSPHSIFCADLDGDIDLDLVVANAGIKNVSILKNNGDGTFQSAVNYGAGDSPWSVFCADLDGDNDLDLAVANASSDNVSILKNNGDGTFQSAINYGVGDGSQSVFCADLDGDGDLDLAVANGNSNNISILKNNGDGTFQSAVNYGVEDYPTSIFCADLDGDTDLDLAVTNAFTANVSILKNNGHATFQSAVNYGTGGGPHSVFCADLDGDGDLDLAVANAYSDNLSILSNCGQGFHPTGIDLVLELWGSGRARPGFDKEYALRYSNIKPTVAYNVTLTLTLPSQVTYLSSTPPGSVSNNVVTWNLGTLSGAGFASVRVNVPSSVPAGTNLTASGDISTTDPDENPNNNNDTETEIVVTSWDPNDKDAQPWGGGSNHYILPHQTLKYTIFFENVDTATAEAIDIMIEDTLDQNLDWSTLSVGPMSHADKCFFSFNSSDGVISWFCDSIMLPPNHIPPEGEGYVSFSIKPDSGLAFGTQIKNRAYIQFDFNPWMAAPDSGPVIRTIGVYGDANGDGVINGADVAYLINYLFVGGPAPQPWEAGNVNCDSFINGADVAYLINYLFIGGPSPGC